MQESYDSLSLDKTLSFYNVKILIQSDINIKESDYHYNIF